MKLISCVGQEFLVTVDMGGNMRMLYLRDLNREPSKYSNITPQPDNSTWSVDGAAVAPPRVAVGSNTHNVTVYDLSTGGKTTVSAHKHNVPCVSFSPCGKYLATTSIDKTLKIWEEGDSGYKCTRMTVPSEDWGWAVQWIDKNNCEISLSH
jgi:WD40 repeat protein